MGHHGRKALSLPVCHTGTATGKCTKLATTGQEASALAWVLVTDLLSHDLAPLDIPLAQRLIDLLA